MQMRRMGLDMSHWRALRSSCIHVQSISYFNVTHTVCSKTLDITYENVASLHLKVLTEFLSGFLFTDDCATTLHNLECLLAAKQR